MIAELHSCLASFLDPRFSGKSDRSQKMSFCYLDNSRAKAKHCFNPHRNRWPGSIHVIHHFRCLVDTKYTGFSNYPSVLVINLISYLLL